MESPLNPNNNGVMSNIPSGYDHNILDELKKIIREEMNNILGNAEIEITPVEPDYRSPRSGKQSYDVIYSKNVEGINIEISGTLKSFNTGRAVEYGFEPGYFTNAESENYWSDNWENIEEEIMNAFYSQKR